MKISSEFPRHQISNYALLEQAYASTKLQIGLNENISDLFVMRLKMDDLNCTLAGNKIVIQLIDNDKKPDDYFSFVLDIDVNNRSLITDYHFDHIPLNENEDSIEVLKVIYDIVTLLRGNILKKFREELFERMNQLTKLNAQKVEVNKKLNHKGKDILRASETLFKLAHFHFKNINDAPHFELTKKRMLEFLKDNQTQIKFYDILPLIKNQKENDNIFETIVDNLRI